MPTKPQKQQQAPVIRSLFFNLEASRESAAVRTMGTYATLLSGPQLRQKMLTPNLAEPQRIHRWLQKLFKTPIRMRRPRFFHTLHARDEGLRRLQAHQIKLLKQWRRTTDDRLLNELLVVVNAIASGQRTTE